MFSTSFSSSKTERQQNTQLSPPSPSPSSLSSSSFGHRRGRYSLSSLSPSLSCPHLPLLTAGKSSPPIVTSAIAFGATTPTVESFWGSCSSKSGKVKEEASTPTAGPARSRRLSMTGFPWEEKSTSGRMSPAAELTENIARRAVTPPVLQSHHPATGFRDRTSPKSSLRLEMPPSRIDSSMGSRIEQAHPLDTPLCGHRHQGGFVGQTLLGLAYPTTPYIGVNNSPVMCEGCKDGGSMHPGRDDGRRGGGLIGGGAVALLAAAPHMGRGGLALLTPPDDNGVLDWQQDGIHRTQAGLETTERMAMGSFKAPVPQNSTPPIVERNPLENEDRADKPLRDGSLPKAPSAMDSVPKPTQRPAEDQLNASTEGEWIGSAIEILVGAAFPVCVATEAIRVLSYTLPCPLPDAPGPEAPSGSTNPAKPDRLPLSAASAPVVAAAAGQQLSPAILARCTAKSGSISLPFRGADLGTTTALHHMTAAIQRRCLNEGTRRVYIHVSHAIDPQIPLTRLPSTPPVSSPPGRDWSEGGYFSPTVFNSIVVAPNSLSSTPFPGTPLTVNPPSFPFSSLILPPGSLHLTLLERYIPPASHLEDSAMFSTRASILIDRLFELSPQGGSLLFIYPTRTGAEEFDREYLGPVLDPLLRKLMVLYRLREDLLWGIRKIAAIEHMAEFPELKGRVEAFCNALTNGEGEAPRMPTKLVYSTKATVSLNELSWREWWTQQEQSRVREIVKKHMSSQPAPESAGIGKGKETENQSGFWTGYGVPGDLAREVLDGVRAPNVRPSSRGMEEAVLASSMSGSGGSSGSAVGTGAVGVGRIAGGTRRLETLKKRGVEVGIFILRRGLDY